MKKTIFLFLFIIAPIFAQQTKTTVNLNAKLNQTKKNERVKIFNLQLFKSFWII